jgi:hypothetical protein
VIGGETVTPRGIPGATGKTVARKVRELEATLVDRDAATAKAVRWRLREPLVGLARVEER